jgi:tetratricopeptide (TPR) repeat protein
MPKTGGKPLDAPAITIFAALAIWAAGLLTAGALYPDRTSGLVCLGTGGVCALIIVLGIVRRSWIVALYGVLAATGAGMITAGGFGVDYFVASGVLALVIVGATMPIALAIRESSGQPANPGTADHRLADLLHEINEHSMLSDNAKRILFREREIALLREAIESDIARGEYTVALTLCDEMANVFGYREEAEEFRQRIVQARQERYESDARAALERLDQLLAERNWAMAHHEAARIRRLYGDSHLVQGVEDRIMQARDEHKRELESEFLQAAQREDVEHAMALLKQLDRYLEPEEAERLSEVAQGVVGKHRENLGVQFKLAVNDRRWAEAARIGDVIINEFPNSKMAVEVRSMIDVLRTRATQAAIAASGE